MTETCSLWKKRLDRALTLGEADTIVEDAISAGNRQDLVQFAHELYKEFTDPDGAGGGEAGTRERIQKIDQEIRLTSEEVEAWGVLYDVFVQKVYHA